MSEQGRNLGSCVRQRDVLDGETQVITKPVVVPMEMCGQGGVRQTHNTMRSDYPNEVGLESKNNGSQVPKPWVNRGCSWESDCDNQEWKECALRLREAEGLQ